VRPAARLALLTALASHQVDASVVAAFRHQAPTDHELLALLSWSSWVAALRVGSWLAPASPGAHRSDLPVGSSFRVSVRGSVP
jgi:hypothetical protein